MPLLEKCAGDAELTVGVLSGLLEDCYLEDQGSLREKTIAAAVNRLFPRMLSFVLRMDMGVLAKLHSLLLDLRMPDKVKAIFDELADNDKTWPTSFYSRWQTFPALRTILEEMRECDVPRTTRHYQDFVAHRLERILWHEVKREPSTAMKRFKAGCGQCQACERLDAFLVSAETQAQFELSVEDITHVASRLKRLPDHSREYNNEAYRGPLRPGDPYVIKKTTTAFERRHSDWERDVKQVKADIKSLGTNGFLRDLLGERYNAIVKMEGLKLVRDANGHEIGYGIFAQEFQARTRGPPIVVGQASQQTSSTAASVPTESPKRKAGTENDQENVFPAAKRTMVVELSSDDEDL